MSELTPTIDQRIATAKQLIVHYLGEIRKLERLIVRLEQLRVDADDRSREDVEDSAA